jgi:hypothetical protein
MTFQRPDFWNAFMASAIADGTWNAFMASAIPGGTWNAFMASAIPGDTWNETFSFFSASITDKST